MKKVFSLILAVAMVLSLASVAFAVVDKYDYLTTKVKDVACYGYQNDYYTLKDGVLTTKTSFVFGTTYYMPIIANWGTTNTNYTVPKGTTLTDDDKVYRDTYYAAFAKQLGSLKAEGNWTEGSEFIAEVGMKPIFVAEDWDGTVINRNVWAIYVKTQGEASKSKSIVGEIVVTGKAGSGAASYKVETKIPVDMKIYYDTATLASKVTSTNATIALERTGANKYTNCEITAVATNKQNTVTFNNDIKATIEGDLDGKYLISFNTIDDEAVLAANPDAAIMTYNITFNFREAAEIEINPIDEEASNYLYQKLPSGAVKDLTSTYVEDDGLFEFSARKLAGTYYVSDMPLVF